MTLGFIPRKKQVYINDGPVKGVQIDTKLVAFAHWQ
jgi:hypothetical protein